MATISELFKKYVVPTTTKAPIVPKIATGATAGASVGSVAPVVPAAISGSTAGFDMSNYKADITEAGIPQPINVNTAKTMFNTMKTATNAGVQAGTQMQPQNALQYNPNQTAGLNVIQQAQPKQTAPQPAPVQTAQPVNVQIPSTLSSEDISSTTTQFKGSQGISTSTADQFMASLNPSLTSLGQTTQQAEQLANQMTAGGISQLQDKQAKLRQEISKLSGDMSQSARKAELEQQYGLNEQLTQLSELNKQIASKSAQYQQAIIENQGRNTLTSQIAGREGQLKRQMAVEIGGLTAMAEAMQGNIDMARSIIKDTVALEYEDKQNQLNTLLQQLEWNREDMTKEEQKEADKLKMEAEAQYAQMEIEQKNREQIMELAMEAAKNGAGMDILGNIMSSRSIEEALYNSGGALSSASVSQVTGTAVPLTAGEQENVNNMLSRIDQIMGTPQNVLDNVLGPLSSRIPTFRTESAELEAYIENLKTSLTLDNLSYLKGAMSDKDIQFITNASSALSTKMSPAAFKAELQNIRQTLNAALNGQQANTQYRNTRADVESVESEIARMSPDGQNVYTSLLSAGVPYSYLSRNKDAIYSYAQSDPNLTSQDLYDAILGGYQQTSFNAVGGDTKQASIQSKLSSAIPAGTTYTNPTDGECGYWSRKIVDYPSGTGDTLASKTAFVKEKGMLKNDWIKVGPKVGDVIFTNDSPTYGHVAVVNAINPDGTITLSESNYKGHYKVSHDRKIALNDPRIVGAVRGKLKTNISNIA